MNLPADYYHCFLGNGLDAVLIGYTGSMVSDKVSVDRCAWYKSDRYYPEDKLVMVAGRWPLDQPLEHGEGSGWYELAPLGRTWYQVFLPDQGDNPLLITASRQRFVPRQGTLYSDVSYGALRVQVTTFLHARRSLLIERYQFDREVELEAWMGPGVWVEDIWDTDPFRSVSPISGKAEIHYDLGETRGMMALHLEPESEYFGQAENDCWLRARGREFVKYFSIADDRQETTSADLLSDAVQSGYNALREEHLAFWRSYFSRSSISIPSSRFQSFYDASLYHFKGMQNPVSGGLPVNNLRRTWSSHIFWDSYFIQRALLEANHVPEALEAIRFFQRTETAARRHARDEFGCDGLKWDWEVTHDGRKAYGALLHMKDQVHNNASYANEIWQYYEFTRDLEVLREFYPILEGIARYFLCDVVEKTEKGYSTRAVVGVHESPIRVRNDGITLAGTIVLLQHTVLAARLLGIESEFVEKCARAMAGLMQPLRDLYNGRYFTASADSSALNMSSLGPIYPMQVLAFTDPWSLSTVQAYREQYHGRMVGHGGDENGFPWSAGVLGTVCARQRQGDQAWEVIEGSAPAICNFGGMTEVMEAGEWNMQYFGTAQGAVCTALHNLLLQSDADEIRVFPALPSSWPEAAFERLLANGCEISASVSRGSGVIEGHLVNVTAEPIKLWLRVGQKHELRTIANGETYRFKSAL
jgi:hypothetical protein